MKRYPLVLSGLILGLTALGNVIEPHSTILRLIYLSISIILFVRLTIQSILYIEHTRQELTSPIVASVFGTYSMSGMLLAVLLKPCSPILSLCLWGLFALLHCVIIGLFSYHVTSSRKIAHVFPSWFIVYVGIAVISMTSPAYQLQPLGQIAFWFGAISFIPLSILVLYRIHIHQNIPNQAMPTIAITCAPLSLLLAGYLRAFSEPIPWIVLLLWTASQLAYIYVLIWLPRLWRRPFSPAFSAFTFPFVITATANQFAFNWVQTQNIVSLSFVSIYRWVVTAEIAFATIIVTIVLLRYLYHLYTLHTKKD